MAGNSLDQFVKRNSFGKKTLCIMSFYIWTFKIQTQLLTPQLGGRSKVSINLQPRPPPTWLPSAESVSHDDGALLHQLHVSIQGTDWEELQHYRQPQRTPWGFPDRSMVNLWTRLMWAQSAPTFGFTHLRLHLINVSNVTFGGHAEPSAHVLLLHHLTLHQELAEFTHQ